MQFTHYPLGFLAAGSVVHVTLEGTEANVRLVDDINLAAYRSGGRHSYYGGHYKRSPVRLTVPRAGQWHVVIDLGGYAGQIRSSVSVVTPNRV